MNFLAKLLFYIKKPKVIIVTGRGRACAAEAIFRVLKTQFRVKKLIDKTPKFGISKRRIFIIETEIRNSNRKELTFLVKASSLPVLIVTNVGDIPPDCEFFSGDRKETKNIRKLAKSLPVFGYLILNFDDEVVREIDDITNLNTFSFGFQEGADFQTTDIKINGGLNFKTNYKGKIVPFWHEKVFGKEQIYSILAAVSTGIIFDLNFVEIAEALKKYTSLPGRMRLISGINNSEILDDSESASVYSMTEAVEVLGKLESAGRKIAVLGDVLGVGKYTIEAHETIGEKVALAVDLLFTVGARAKFIAQGAVTKGMKKENIFQFDTIESIIPELQKTIKEGDLILVDGSKEMEMEKIVHSIKR